MCGFVGYKINQSHFDEQKIIKSMADAIIHRGPDDEGYHIDCGIALGFRRLSIIDLNSGKQPISNEDGSIVLVFNGEIYNFKLLREELLKAGHVFKTHTDSEVILHGYEQYGADILSKLRGMFAFIIWDKKEDKIFGARDIFGIKPLYYYKNENDFLFASEIKAFLPHPDFKKEVNASLLPTYLCYEYIPTSETFFKNVFKLPGGHYFEYKSGTLDIKRYFKIEYSIENGKDIEYWANEVEKVFCESVAVHQISDVEVGCFLSGGLDSSLVAHEIARSSENKNEDAVKTFSVGYAQKEFSELDDAKQFADSVGLPNIAKIMDADMLFDAAPVIQYHLDEPLPNISEVPLYFLAQKASEYVKVVVSGEGADELFGGYPLYQAEANQNRYSVLPLFLRKAIAAVSRKLPSFPGKNFVTKNVASPEERYPRCNYVFTEKNRYDVLKDKTPCVSPTQYAKGVFDECKGVDNISAFQYADIHIWMAFDILQKADKMSMAHSLELRVPYLDKEVLSLAMRIPAKYRASSKNGKLVLRKYASKVIRSATANMPKKGFPVPLDSFLREEKYYNMVKEKFSGDVAEMFFDVEAINKLLLDHKNGAKNMRKIWTVYSFILWYEEFFVKR